MRSDRHWYLLYEMKFGSGESSWKCRKTKFNLFFNQEGKCALWLDDDIYMQSVAHRMHASYLSENVRSNLAQQYNCIFSMSVWFTVIFQSCLPQRIWTVWDLSELCTDVNKYLTLSCSSQTCLRAAHSKKKKKNVYTLYWHWWFHEEPLTFITSFYCTKRSL